MVKSVVTLGLAIGLTVAARGDAHPLHSSFTEITRERSGMLTMSIRLFTDDFSSTLELLRASSGGATGEAVAQAYFARSVFLLTADGKPVPLVWCGMRSEQNATRLCARTSKPVDGAFVVRNSLMFDRFSDQLSIISWSGRKGTRTVILSARVLEARLD